uniref:hypothetical protein n=1 Tax=Cupriavidus necator TaxID=106590 RepID=UPI003F49939C
MYRTNAALAAASRSTLFRIGLAQSFDAFARNVLNWFGSTQGRNVVRIGRAPHGLSDQA